MAEETKYLVHVTFQAFCQEMQVLFAGIMENRMPDWSGVKEDSNLTDFGIDALSLSNVTGYLQERFDVTFIPEELDQEIQLTFGMMYEIALKGCFKRFVEKAEQILDASLYLRFKLSVDTGLTLEQASVVSIDKNEICTLFYFLSLSIEPKDINLDSQTFWDVYRTAVPTS